MHVKGPHHCINLHVHTSSSRCEQHLMAAANSSMSCWEKSVRGLRLLRGLCRPLQSSSFSATPNTAKLTSGRSFSTAPIYHTSPYHTDDGAHAPPVRSTLVKLPAAPLMAAASTFASRQPFSFGKSSGKRLRGVTWVAAPPMAAEEEEEEGVAVEASAMVQGD